MNELKNRLQRRAGFIAFAAAAAVFGVMSLVKPHSNARPILVPVVQRFVASGTQVPSKAIQWINENRLKAITPKKLRGYAKVALFPGQIMSPQLLESYSPGIVLVAVVPSNPVDVRVASVGENVEVLVSNRQGVKWQSGPLEVVSRTTGGGAVASVNLAMSMKVARAFEAVASHGSVELVGLPS